MLFPNNIMAITQTEMKEVMGRLGSVEIELMRLRAMLLPTAKPTKRELKAIEEAKKEMARGEWVAAERLFKSTG